MYRPYSNLSDDERIEKLNFWVEAEIRYLRQNLKQARKEIDTALAMAEALAENPSIDTTMDSEATDISAYFLAAERALDLVRFDCSSISAELWEIHNIKARAERVTEEES